MGYRETQGFGKVDSVDVHHGYANAEHSDVDARHAGHFYVEFDGAGVDSHGLDGVHDLRGLSAAEVDHSLTQLREQLSHQRLDVAGGQVLDVRLSLLPSGRTRVHVKIDMLVCDALSFRVVIANLAQLYLSPQETLDPVNYGYPRYLADRMARRQSTRERDRAYWRARLDELPGAPQLPLATAPQHLRRPRTVRRHHRLDPDEFARLAGWARDHDVTLSMVLVTAFAEIIAGWSAEQRFLLNLPLFDREAVLLAVDATSEESFLTRARGVQDRFRADAAHSGLRDLGNARPETPANAPVVFTSALGMGELFTGEVRQALGTPVWMSSQTPGVWLDLQVVEHDGGLLLNWESVDGLFPDGVPDAMFAAFVDLVTWLATPSCRWDEPVPALLPRSQARVRDEANATATAVPQGALHERFFETARHRPDAIAVAWDGEDNLSYGELAERALRLAGRLRALGLAEGESVALTLPRGPDQVAAVLGVLAAGCTYVPVGIDQPVHRRHQIYRRCGARAVVTGSGTGVEATSAMPIIDIDGDGAVAALDRPVPVSPDQIAYVIYTSGSTGQPKGVEISHRAALNTVQATNERFGVTRYDRTLAVSALDFDLSVYDMFGPLCAGGAVVCVTEAERGDARRWMELVRAHAVTILNCVPALLDMLLVAAEETAESLGLRLVLLGGDWVGLDLPGRVARQCPACRFVALGGTTETAIHSTVCEVDLVPARWRSIPYGFPLPNQSCRVVDSRGRDCPDWVPGELWIGGTGVASGYRGDPDRTADRFVRHDGNRWYRTGDLARYWPDGTLEFLGRADFQVKINGHRIELGEIEIALKDHPGVAGAVVATVGERGQRLAAMAAVRPDTSDGPPDAESLREFLRGRLPGYMVPDRIAVVEALPLSTNGKIDRKAVLSTLAEVAVERQVEEPDGEVETRLAALWAMR